MAWMKTLVPMHHTNPLPEVSVRSTEEAGMPDNVVARGEEIVAQRLGCSLPDARVKLDILSTDLSRQTYLFVQTACKALRPTAATTARETASC